MSNGVLLAAFDSVNSRGQTLHYRRIAQIVANLVRKRLHVPVALMTDNPIPGFDYTILTPPPSGLARVAQFGAVHETYAWKNDVRRRAFKLSPFDRTLMMDVDYFPISDRLGETLRSDEPFMIVRDAHDPTGRANWDKYDTVPNNTIPQLWATVMCWNKDARLHFEYADSIAENYSFYSAMFGFPKTPLRNDLVFSIVGHQLGYAPMPGKMWMTAGDVKLTGPRPNTVRSLRFTSPGNMVTNINSDIHILDKSLATNTELLGTLFEWSR